MFHQPGETFYEQVGGHDTFVALVSAFYDGVKTDPELRALYPEEDLGPAEVRLRMRHVPFAVTLDMRDRWLRHMYAAMDRVELPEAHAEAMRDYFFRAAHMLVNTDDDGNRL